MAWVLVSCNLAFYLIRMASQNYNFIDVSAERKSKVWKYFLADVEKKIALCKKCEIELKLSDGSTKTLSRHLHSKHKIDITKEPEPARTPNRGNNQPKITRFGVTSNMTLDELVTDMIIDGASLNYIVKNIAHREAFKNMGSPLPKSANTVRKLILQCYVKTKDKLVESLALKLEKGERFSLTLGLEL